MMKAILQAQEEQRPSWYQLVDHGIANRVCRAIIEYPGVRQMPVRASLPLGVVIYVASVSSTALSKG